MIRSIQFFIQPLIRNFFYLFADWLRMSQAVLGTTRDSDRLSHKCQNRRDACSAVPVTNGRDFPAGNADEVGDGCTRHGSGA
ncbi:MAG: hypothetical protein CL917_00410 [Deltaproteobacteria bacterium]|nr:hypothetical protein [Deltaproteobacteria bacterium]